MTAGPLLSATALTLPTLAAFAPLVLAPLLAIVAVAIIFFDNRRTATVLQRHAPWLGILVALGVWAALSSSWSILPSHSLLEGVRLLAINASGVVTVAAAMTLGIQERQKLGAATIAGVWIAVALLAIERSSDAAISRLIFNPDLAIPVSMTRFDRGATTLALVLWPALVTALGHRRLTGAIFLASMVPALLGLLSSQTAVVAVLVGLAATGIARMAPRVVAATLAGAMIVLAITLPLFTPSYAEVAALQPRLPSTANSAIHRLLIWRFTADRIAERPALGWGMDAARALPGSDFDVGHLPGITLPAPAPALPLHPHNALLQWQVELGIVGTLLGLAVVLYPLWHAGWRTTLTPRRRAAALGWATSAFCIAFASYGAWQAWWLSCLWLTAALVAGAGVDRPTRSPDGS